MTRGNRKLDISILIVEDDLVCSLMTQVKLKQLGVETVNTIENGILALSYLQSNHPDLIFLDINMPGMDGFEFLKTIQDNNICPGTPIVMLTSSIRTCDREKSMEFERVIDYIEKPLDTDKIKRVLAKLPIHYTGG